jgi:ABC-type Fe3+/spermidine/putrescine transport system ATPase subunit
MFYIEVRKQLRDYELIVRLEHQRKDLILLSGRNGSGKTTLLNLIAGLTAPDSGKIIINGALVYDSIRSLSVPPEKRGIGYVFQHYALFPHLNVYDNVAFGLRTKKLSGDEIRRFVDQYLFSAGLRHLRNERIQDLSGGEKQKVALARTLITKPRLLLLDEPLSALDSGSREKYRMELKKNIKDAKIPAIMVSHDPMDAGMADRVCTIKNGVLG